MVYVKFIKRIYPRALITRKKTHFFPFFSIRQITILYNLNLYSDVFTYILIKFEKIKIKKIFDDNKVCFIFNYFVTVY